MASSKPQEEPKRKKPGPEPDRLVIDPEDAEEAVDRLLGKKPKPRPEEERGEEVEEPEGSDE